MYVAAHRNKRGRSHIRCPPRSLDGPMTAPPALAPRVRKWPKMALGAPESGQSPGMSAYRLKADGLTVPHRQTIFRFATCRIAGLMVSMKKTGPEGPASLTGRCQRCAWEARGRHASDPNIHAHVVPVGSDPGHILRLKVPRAAVVGDPLGMSALGHKRTFQWVSLNVRFRG